MKSNFPGWYPKTPNEAAALWDKAIFVPDANVLLHCLRHPATVRDELLRVFDVLKDSIWIPHQVGLEFHRNRLDVEFGAQDAYDALLKDQLAVIEKARERLRQLRAHPVISVEKELAALDMFATDFKGRMETARASHPSEQIAAAVDRLATLLVGRIGEKWPADRLAALKKEGEARYAAKTPPGYMDAKKDGGEFDKFGDLIIWKDMIEKAKEEQRPVIFISDDAKEDWWWIHRGRKMGPRPELIEEFRVGSDQVFHLYEFGQFLRFAAQRHPEIEEGVSEVEKSLREDERARQRQSDAAIARDTSVRMRELEDERDQIVGSLAGTPGPSLPPRMDRAELRRRLEVIDTEIATLNSPDHAPHPAPASETSE